MHSIFNYFLRRGEDSVEDANKRIAYAAWFIESFQIDEFSKEEFIMYKVLSYSVKLNIPLKEKYIRTFLDSELKELVLKNNIRVTGTAELSNTEDLVQVATLIAATKEVMIGCYWDLLNEVGSVDEFVADADKFMTERLDERSIEIMGKAYEMRSTETKGFVGVRDSAEMLREEMSMLLETYDKDKLEELASATTADSKEMEFVTDTGIPAIDKDTMGGHAGQLFGIEAGPGVGKTRFAVGVWAYRAAVVHNRNVLYYSLEQSFSEIEALFISRHIYTLYKIEIDSKLILFNKVPKEFEDKVKAAKLDLFESGKYGKIDIQASGKRDSMILYLETFVDKMKMRDKLHGPYQVIIIDYMGLIEQKPRKRGEYSKSLDDHQVIQRAYKKFKRYLLNTLKFGIAVNQLNRSGAEKSKKDQDIETTDAQGGMEVYRSTDYNFAITMTDAMKAERLRRVSCPKVRNGEGLGNLLLKTKLGCCLWQQAPSNVV